MAILFLHTFNKMDSEGKKGKQPPNGEMWKSVFLSTILGILALTLALSVFFYVRSRESMWDNRSKLSRLVATNHNTSNFGVELFTVFGEGEGGITLNGASTIENFNTLFVTAGSVYIVELVGVTDTLASFDSKLVVSPTSITIMTPGDVQVSPVEVEISSVTGVDKITAELVGSRIELRGTTPASKYQFAVRVLGRKF